MSINLLSKSDMKYNNDKPSVQPLTPEDINRLRQGDEHVFERLFKQYYEPLCNFSFSIIQNQSETENLVQEVLYQVWKNRHRLNPEKNIKTYLFTATKNQSLKYLRRVKHHRQYIDTTTKIHLECTAPDDAILNHELEQALTTTIHALPEKCKTIFCMNRFDHLTYREIAEIQGVSIKAVEKQMTKALKLLRKRLFLFVSIL